MGTRGAGLGGCPGRGAKAGSVQKPFLKTEVPETGLQEEPRGTRGFSRLKSPVMPHRRAPGHRRRKALAPPKASAGTSAPGLAQPRAAGRQGPGSAAQGWRRPLRVRPPVRRDADAMSAPRGRGLALHCDFSSGLDWSGGGSVGRCHRRAGDSVEVPQPMGRR